MKVRLLSAIRLVDLNCLKKKRAHFRDIREILLFCLLLTETSFLYIFESSKEKKKKSSNLILFFVQFLSAFRARDCVQKKKLLIEGFGM